MIRVPFLISAALIMVATQNSSIEQTTFTGSELRTVVQDDERLTVLMTEIWVLRDLLALQQSGDISVQSTTFQDLQDQIRDHQPAILDLISKDLTGINAPGNVQATAATIATKLDEFGVRRDSELSKRLINAYVMFSQILLIDSLEPLCGLHPFRELC